MFATFSSTPDQGQGNDGPSQQPRPKRHQVSRACVWCRANRIKCDTNHPCGNCKAKGRNCVSESKDPVRSFPAAIKEIDHLRERVKELESQLKELQVQQQPSPDYLAEDESPSIKPEETVLPEQLDFSSRQERHREIYNHDFVTSEVKPGSTQTYGCSSTFYFVSQLASYLDAAFQEQPSGSTPDLSPSPRSSIAQELQGALSAKNTDNPDRAIVQEDLSKVDEEKLLEFYWSSWHILYPILRRDEFTTYYDTLWKPSETTRHPSALVDIILALCMQLRAAIAAAYQASGSFHPPTDSTAGWWYYRRSQYFIHDDLEAPTISTFQCHFLAICWLSRASWHNTAHNILAAGLRIGVTLGLHLEPSSDLPPDERESRKLIWWTMYAIDAQYALELGRPLGVQFGQVTCTLPQNVPKLDGQSSNAISPTSFNTQLIKLILASRAIYSMFYRVCIQLLRQSGESDLFRDKESLQTCSKWLETNISYLKAWADQVPAVFRTNREKHGIPYSTDRSRLELHPGDELARGRLVLELLYHQFAMCLYRHFLSFSHTDPDTTAIVGHHAISCVNHAITITQIIHQDITESDSLRVWSMICTWQWHASLSIAGYILAYPRGPATPAGRKALSIGIATFEVLSDTFTNAISCVQGLRRLVEKVDVLLGDTQLSIAATQMENSLLSSSINASVFDYESLPRLYDEWDRQGVPDVIPNWINPEFSLPEFSHSEMGGFSANWLLDLLDPGSISRQ